MRRFFDHELVDADSEEVEVDGGHARDAPVSARVLDDVVESVDVWVDVAEEFHGGFDDELAFDIDGTVVGEEFVEWEGFVEEAVVV